MHFISHRVNTVEELKRLPYEYGVEIDLRDEGSDLILSHDPFSSGDRFEEYLKEYHHGTMILNIKSERIEHKIKTLLDQYQIENYFFLDSSFPMIYLLSSQGEKRIALRYSEFEGLDTIRAMAGKVDWVWVDCFTLLPINHEIFLELKALGYKICLVSPELQGRPEDIEVYKRQSYDEKIEWDAICTKFYNIERWK
jgi:hypothetical protein